MENICQDATVPSLAFFDLSGAFVAGTEENNVEIFIY